MKPCSRDHAVHEAERVLAAARRKLADLEAKAVAGRATDDVSPRVYAAMAEARVEYQLAERALAKVRETAARTPIVVEDVSHMPRIILSPPEETNGHVVTAVEVDE